MRRNTVIWQGHVQGGSAFCFLSGISRVKCALREFKLRCTGLSIDRPRRDHAFMDGPVTGLDPRRFPEILTVQVTRTSVQIRLVRHAAPAVSPPHLFDGKCPLKLPHTWIPK